MLRVQRSSAFSVLASLMSAPSLWLSARRKKESKSPAILMAKPFIPQQLIDCIGTGRQPTEKELLAQAMQMWIDGAADRSAGAWQGLAEDASERLFALAGARMALSGSSLA